MADKGHALMIAMGLGPKQGPAAPPSVAGKLGMGGSVPTQPNPTQSPDPATQSKVSQEEAGYLEDQMCGACTYFTKETGDCAKVEGPVKACGGCKLYSAANPNSGEPDQDDMQLGVGGTHGSI